MIVITAPTAKIGGRVLERVLEGEEPVRVIARDPAKLDPATRARVEVVQGSHREAAVVDRAFAGADAVFWLVPADRLAATVDEAYSGFAQPGIAALVQHGVRHVVGVSALGRGTPVADRAGHVTATLAMDDLIAKTGVHYRALANPSFMDNSLRDVPALKNGGVFGLPVPGDLRTPMVATRDIGDVAATLLRERDWTGVAEVPLLGPEDLSGEQLAAILTEVLGAPITYRQTSAEDLRGAMTGFLSPAMVEAMVDMMVAKSQGLDRGVARTAEISALTPTTFRAWCEQVLKPAYDAA